jgi:glycyl-tRNA synthetase
MDELISLLKRRGFIWQSSEIYGGAANAYDYGPLGVLLKNNVKNHWMKSMIKSDESIVPLDSAILMHPKVWEASGHLENFADPMVECQKCKRRYRADHAEDVCSVCGGALGEPRLFNLLFKTHLGSVEDSSRVTYLRPETAQGAYVSFKLVQQAMRLKLPFGIAQIGKAFRNEITPSHFTYRTVEFEQMEMQFFVRPEDAPRWFDEWKERRLRWHIKGLGIRKEHLRFVPHGKDELAHYARAAEDIQFKFPFGWSELEGVHNRGDWDLSRHQEFSGKEMSYFDEETGEKLIPYIVETAVGADRATLAMLVDAYHEEEVKGESRVVLRLNPYFAPYRLAVFPLVRTDQALVAKAVEIFNALRKKFSAIYDESGSIGRRYRRQDEIGTPWAITVDGKTLEDGTVTVRDRDTLAQERVSIEELESYIQQKLKSMIDV